MESWTIGLVEDELKYRQNIVELLSDEPDIKEILTWESAEEFWRDERKTKLDLVLLDIRLRHMDGVELAGMYHELQPEINIVMLTTIAEEDVVADVEPPGPVRVLQLGFDPRQLLLREVVGVGDVGAEDPP